MVRLGFAQGETDVNTSVVAIYVVAIYKALGGGWEAAPDALAVR
jgi:hypothetical protein